jgi:hypothetical protein
MSADPPDRRFGWKFVCALLGLVASLAVMAATKHGAGVAPNSVSYLTAAENLAAGKGLLTLNPDGAVVPLTMWPPLLPTILAIFSIAGVDPVVGVRWFHVILSGCNVFLIGLLAWKVSGSAVRAVAGSWLFLFALENLEYHAFVLSEPLFMLCLLLGIYFLSKHLATDRVLHIILASAAFALAVLTRHAGLAFLGGTAAAIFLAKREDKSALLRSGAIFSLVAGLPVMAWFVRNKLVAESAVGRPASLHLDIGRRLVKGVDSVSAWVLPQSVTQVWKFIAVGVVVFGVLLAWKYGRRWISSEEGSEKHQLRRVIQVFILAYSGLLATVILVDAWIPLSRRVMSPLFILVLLLVLGSFPRTSWFPMRPALTRASLAGLLSLFCAFYAIRGVNWVRSARAEGIAYSTEVWQRSGLMSRVRDLPDGTPIFTNAVEAVYYLTGRMAKRVPVRINRFSRVENEDFPGEMASMGSLLREDEGVIVFLSGLGDRTYLPTLGEIRNSLDVTELGEWEEGVLLTGR